MRKLLLEQGEFMLVLRVDHFAFQTLVIPPANNNCQFTMQNAEQ